MIEKEERPWGQWSVLDKGIDWKVKKIEVQSGKRLSLQKHHHRCEFWVIVEGECKVTKGEEVVNRSVGEWIFIEIGEIHRIEAITDTVIIEVQRGNYLGEDDIVRIEDDWGRKNNK